MPRDTAGYRIKETWDTLGMRATRSDDTILDGAFVPDQYIARILPAGAPDLFIVALFAWALMGFGNIYYGIARRARDLAIANVKKQDLAGADPLDGLPPRDAARDRADDARARGDRAAARPHRRGLVDGVDHGAVWPAKIFAAKYHASRRARRWSIWRWTCPAAPACSRRNELERLYRDARCGGFHPANSTLTHEIVGKTTLGIGLDEQPRWG